MLDIMMPEVGTLVKYLKVAGEGLLYPRHYPLGKTICFEWRLDPQVLGRDFLEGEVIYQVVEIDGERFFRCKSTHELSNADRRIRV